jgi:hypothetical protein
MNLTFCTITVHFQFVPSYYEFVVLGNLLLNLLYGFFSELHHLAAIYAAKVTVMVMSINVFIMEMTVFKIRFLDETTLQ